MKTSPPLPISWGGASFFAENKSVRSAPAGYYLDGIIILYDLHNYHFRQGWDWIHFPFASSVHLCWHQLLGYTHQLLWGETFPFVKLQLHGCIISWLRRKALVDLGRGVGPLHRQQLKWTILAPYLNFWICTRCFRGPRDDFKAGIRGFHHCLKPYWLANVVEP